MEGCFMFQWGASFLSGRGGEGGRPWGASVLVGGISKKNRHMGGRPSYAPPLWETLTPISIFV